MSLEVATNIAVEFFTKKLELLNEAEVFAEVKEVLTLYENPTVEFIGEAQAAVDEFDVQSLQTNHDKQIIADIESKEPLIPMSDGETDYCDIYEDVETVTTVLGVDCEAGAIEGFKDLAEKLVSEEAAANIQPGHPLYELVQAQQAGDMAEVNRQAGILAQSFDFWQPDQTAESAQLIEGTQFVLDDSGVFTVVGPDGQVLAMSDCDGIVTKYAGPMIDSGECVVCEEPEPSVAEAQPIVEQPDGPKVQTVEVCVAPGVCQQFESVLIFDSVEQAQEYFSHPENIKNFPDTYQDSLQTRYRFFIVADGDGYVQCLPFDIRGDEMHLKTGRMFPLELYNEKQKLVGHMSEGVAEKYFNGYVGTDGPRSSGALEFDVTKGETIFPSAPQALVFNPETGAHELEPFDTSVERTFRMWVTEAGLTGSEWNQINDMLLPEEFADPTTSVTERATALREAAAERGVVLTQENAEELTRIITEGALGEDAGLRFNEQALKDMPMNDGQRADLTGTARTDGQMIRLDSALITASENITYTMRLVQGF